MGQKVNIYTLRSDKIKINDLNSPLHESVYLHSFIKILQYFFWHKKIFLTNTILYSVNNKLYFNLFLLYRVAKLKYYYGKKYKKKFFKRSNILKLSSLNNSFKKAFKSISLLNKNLLIFKFNNLNILALKKRKLFLKLYYLFKKDAVIIFPRRFNFFLEFIQITLLFLENKVNIHFFIKILSEVFRILQKKRHAKFFSFINKYFNSVTKTQSDYCVYPIFSGIKFIISGKLKGKPRSSHYSKVFGKAPIQTMKCPIEYSKIHAFTIYGVFGLQLWIYKSDKRISKKKNRRAILKKKNSFFKKNYINYATIKKKYINIKNKKRKKYIIKNKKRRIIN